MSTHLIVIFTFLFLTLSQGKMSSWTSASGSTLQAEFMGVANGAVELKRASGKVINVPFSKLSEESQQQALALSGGGQAASARGAADRGGFATEEDNEELVEDDAFYTGFVTQYLKKNPYLRKVSNDQLEKTLPVMPGSPFVNTFSLHRGKIFDAIMNTRGGVEIFLKGGPTLYLTPIIRFTQDQGTSVDRYPVTVRSDQRPSLDANAFACEFTYHGEVEATIRVDIRGNEISYSCTAKDGKSGKDLRKSRIQYVAAISTMPNQGLEPGNVEHTQAAEETVLLFHAKGEEYPQPLTTSSSFYSLATRISEMTLSGPLMGPRMLTVEPPREREGEMRGSSISKTEWWKGFGFKFYKNDARKRAPLKLVIE